MYVGVYFKIVTFQNKELQNIVYIIESLPNKAHLPYSTHLRLVGYYRKVAEQSEEKGFNIMEVIPN